MRITVDLAQHVSRVGFQGVQLGPTYYIPTEGDVLRLFQSVTQASDTSIMIYHTWWEGLNMRLDLLRHLAAIETVRALKWGAPNEVQFRWGIIALANELVIIDNQASTS